MLPEGVPWGASLRAEGEPTETLSGARLTDAPMSRARRRGRRRGRWRRNPRVCLRTWLSSGWRFSGAGRRHTSPRRTQTSTSHRLIGRARHPCEPMPAVRRRQAAQRCGPLRPLAQSQRAQRFGTWSHRPRTYRLEPVLAKGSRCFPPRKPMTHREVRRHWWGDARVVLIAPPHRPLWRRRLPPRLMRPLPQLRTSWVSVASLKLWRHDRPGAAAFAVAVFVAGAVALAGSAAFGPTAPAAAAVAALPAIAVRQSPRWEAR